MSQTDDKINKVRFRPTSKKDFSRYARDLSWLIKEPLQKTQGMLARMYGYGSLHELQMNMAKPGEPGPFDIVGREE